MDKPNELKTPQLPAQTFQKMSIPRLRKPTAKPTGPKHLKLGANLEVKGGPGDPPPGFLSPANSRTEWYIYWALAKIFGNPTDPTVGPFMGGPPDWSYQQAINGGAGILGGSTIDFVVNSGRRPTAFRIVTEYYHIFTGRSKQVSDEMQKIMISNRYEVVDLYDMDFINDPSGQQVIQVVKMGLSMIERPNPLLTGVALRGSRMDRVAG